MTKARFAGFLLLTALAAPAQVCTSVVAGTSTNDYFGWSMICIGDVDGDGAKDLAVGAPQAANPGNASGQFGPGYVKVISGRTGVVLRTIAAPAGPGSRGMFGFSLAAFADSDGDGLPNQAGDVDGDGWPDFLVGAPSYVGSRSEQGIVYIVSGRTGVTAAVQNPGSPLTATENFGWSVTALGLVAGSARPAFAVGAPGTAVGSSGNRGRVDVFGWPSAGSTPSVIAQRFGTQTGQNFGVKLLGVGLASGNSSPDLLVASADVNALGIRAVEMLAANALTLRHTFAGTFVGFGTSLGGLGDLTGDGRPEFAIGGNDCASCVSNLDELASLHTWPATAGAPLILVRTYRPRFNMTTALGVSRGIAAAGDLDGDLIPDIVIGVPLADPVGTATANSNAGELRIYSGASIRAGSPRVLAAFDGRPLENLGSVVSCLGDVDGDLAPDFAFAAPLHAGKIGRVVINRFARRAQQYGSGCPLSSASATPELHVTADGGPCLGSTFELHTTQFLANRLHWIGLGFAAANIPSFPRPGCSIDIRIDADVFFVSGPDTFASLSLTVPNDPTLRGLQLYGQSVVFNSSAFDLGSTGVTRAVHLQI